MSDRPSNEKLEFGLLMVIPPAYCETPIPSVNVTICLIC